jgi:hypothetical protein
VQDPHATAADKARAVGAQFSETFSANRFRVSLHRAREKFAKKLRRQVEESLENPTEATLRRELVDLRLFKYCDVA